MRWDVINWPLYIFLLPSEIGAMRKTGQVVEKEATFSAHQNRGLY